MAPQEMWKEKYHANHWKGKDPTTLVAKRSSNIIRRAIFVELPESNRKLHNKEEDCELFHDLYIIFRQVIIFFWKHFIVEDHDRY